VLVALDATRPGFFRSRSVVPEVCGSGEPRYDRVLDTPEAVRSVGTGGTGRAVPCQAIGEYELLTLWLTFPYERSTAGDGDYETLFTQDAHRHAHRAARDAMFLLQVALARQERARLQLAGGDLPAENVRKLHV
jgi:hypothetical protein